jgi:predicted Zn-dependent protease
MELSARFRHVFAAQLLCAASATLAADNPAMWRVEPMIKSTAPAIKLIKGPQKSEVGSVSTARLRILMDVKTRIEQQVGIAAELVLMEGAQPNAFSTPTSKSGPLVGINLGMMELVGDDRDAYAAVLGHEYAHLTLKHREARMGREGLRQAGTVVLSLILAAKGVNYGAGDIANLATSAISMTFSREEERDADGIGLQFAGNAGFDPYGAVRIWERMAARGNTTVPFLSSHPASIERVENMKVLAKNISESSAATDTEIVAEGVKIHGVVFAETGGKIVVKEAPDDARTTLRAGDTLVTCYDKAGQELKLASLGNCRTPSGAYAFTVEREAEPATAMLLKPR